ncbi:ABC transporter ATP-binding protein [Neisseria weaveri]|uniref:ABC transporter ATP-binding protein n=1 Tax=Neisseria weaveri TaxID=28091 RepID=UPI000D30693A|nr:ABC transporter ATP-binding protein [Neisseria weaveri]
MMQADTLFSVRRVVLNKKGRLILDVPQLDLPKGCHTAVIGPNGAGKSTLLRGLLGVWGGDIRLQGMPIAEALKAGSLAWVGQHGQYTLPLTVRDYVLLGRYPHGGWFDMPSSQHIPEVEPLLAAFDLSHLAEQRIGSLSGGEQQRANLVRALLQQAPVLLLDEPCNHLDIRHQHGLMQYLKQNKQSFSAVMVLHDLNMAAHYADYIVLLDQGRLVAAGTPEEVMTAERLSGVYRWPVRRTEEDGKLHFRMDMVA